VVVCLQRGADHLHMVRLMPLPPHHLLLQAGLTFLQPAFPGCPGNEAVKGVSVFFVSRMDLTDCTSDAV